ncbi:GGDEF domain-containing protein [Paraburkholderia phymatum]|uniref:diguanylate cyclase n=1 Tax=Paraburkholderia phymatum (strain DSM 17167 / CIP 108236 / LMG 21445 / STM815) TaxID=391038 RepID=B2JIL0_PARP8|nr:GGDEF domain-containing protein [Paraburkholderia phymatum]ACC72056.1 diguanylate cyclase [Paraburkholderia phymatum STM815]
MKSIHDLRTDDIACEALLGALDGRTQLVAIYDASDRLMFANSAFKHAFRLNRERGDITFADLVLRGILGQCGPRIGGDDASAVIADAIAARRERAGQRSFATELVDGRWFWMTESLLENDWIVLTGTEISALRSNEQAWIGAHERAVQEARTDALTGLANRRHSMSSLELAITAAAGTETPLTVALVDLDHFKQINDSHGHAAGDAVLRDFGEVCRHATRQTDIAGRIGGEEFLVVFPSTSVEHGVSAVERMRRQVLSRRVQVADDRAIRYSFSAGVCRVELSDDLNTTLARADSALYSAKREGRNRTVAWSAPLQ